MPQPPLAEKQRARLASCPWREMWSELSLTSAEQQEPGPEQVLTLAQELVLRQEPGPPPWALQEPWLVPLSQEQRPYLHQLSAPRLPLQTLS